MPIETIFFDLDGTLYGEESGLWELLVGRINLFMRDRVGLHEGEIADIRQEYLGTYGTTLRGLHIHYQVDPDEYLDFVHDIPVEERIHRNRELGSMLQMMPQTKWIWTNASKAHAERVLEALGVSGFFKGIIDIKGMKYQNKPQLAAYTIALDQAGQLEAGKSLFVEDRIVNLEPAAELGARTVWVGTKEPHPAASLSIERVEDLLEKMPELARKAHV